MNPGRLIGVGLGPGDPELVTIKAARLIEAADVIAYHHGPGKPSHARRIADPYISEGVTEERLEYPVTTGATDHPGGYAGVMVEFYEECARRIGTHLTDGRDVVVLAEGDPLFYSSYMYIHDRLSGQYEAEIVPGIPAFAAASAAVGKPLARQTDLLTVLPGTLPRPELARRLADTDAAVIMKLGRTFPHVRAALAEAGRLSDAWYVERATLPDQRWLPAADVDPSDVPYFSLIIVPGDTHDGRRRYDQPGLGARQPGGPVSDPSDAAVQSGAEGPSAEDAADTMDQAGATMHPAAASQARSADQASAAIPTGAVARNGEAARRPELWVVGVGPGADEWVTPEAADILARVDHIVGYGPYLDRVRQRPGLRRHASGNTVEVERARQALDLALAGERVAVVSGGDAGVFGMASAVFEAAEAPAYADVDIRVAPGISAVQAVAARAGAPIGGDFAVLNLSDRLKSWELIQRRVHAIMSADLVLALYNPRSRSRTTQLGALRDIVREHRDPETVVIVGRAVGRDDEELQVTTLAEFDVDSVDMRCLVIIGATSTRATPGGRAWTPRYGMR